MRVSFVISNPNHHAELMVPVAHELQRDGADCRIVSIAELRGLVTPALDLPVRRVLPRIRRNPSSGAGGGGRPTLVRALARTALWRGVLEPRLRWLLRGSDVVVIPNDTAFPYGDLAASLRCRHMPVVLLQEGIRFPLPNERGNDTYGKAGVDRVCVWGEGSADHFRAVGVPASTIRVTGNPRFDALDPRPMRERALRDVASPPLVYLSNPVDDQGFCSTTTKLELFERFVMDATPVLAENAVELVVKLHPREDRAAFQRILERHGSHAKIVDGKLFDWLARARAAVVLASTVGLEALAFDVPIAALELPGHGFVFEYVSRGAAVGIRLDEIANGVRALLARDPGRQSAGAALLERHLAHRGHASHHVAETIRSLEASWHA